MSIIRNHSAYERAIHNNIIANANKTWSNNQERAGEIESWIFANSRRNKFAESLEMALSNYGKLSPKQCDAVLKIIDNENQRKEEWDKKRQEQSANSEFVGAIKERKSFTGKFIYETGFHTDYGYHGGYTYIFKFIDDDGNIIVVKNTTGMYTEEPNEDGEHTLVKGEHYSFTATIAKHNDYNGEKQTQVNRVKNIQKKSLTSNPVQV